MDDPAMVVDWDAIDHVLLDMDGTVLDLWFDNRFWRELVPQRYAERRGLSLQAAQAALEPHFRDTQGLLQWYCLDHWSGVTGLDLVSMKHEVRDWIAPLPGAVDFLNAAREHGKALWLVTNAHRGALEIKLAQTALQPHFDRIVSSHDFGWPKEHPEFWRRLIETFPFLPERCVFVDDSLPVLQAAHDFGIAEVIAIRRPDSSQPAREVKAFKSVNALSDMNPSRVTSPSRIARKNTGLEGAFDDGSL